MSMVKINMWYLLNLELLYVLTYVNVSNSNISQCFRFNHSNKKMTLERFFLSTTKLCLWFFVYMGQPRFLVHANKHRIRGHRNWCWISLHRDVDVFVLGCAIERLNVYGEGMGMPLNTIFLIEALKFFEPL